MNKSNSTLVSLIQAGLIASERADLFAQGCRDADIAVFRDSLSGVIYLDPAFVGLASSHYEKKEVNVARHPRNDMDWADTTRRAGYLAPYLAGKRWLDFGCGAGYQLRQSAACASHHLGIELNHSNCDLLKSDGFSVSADLNQTDSFVPQVISLFHVLEHLSEPYSILRKLWASAEEGAVLLVEVPHARDALLMGGNAEFKAFTLWSEHLILHTRQSLTVQLSAAGWLVKEVIGVQRYPVWNHAHWLAEGKPSGLKNSLLDASASALHNSYEQYLAARDATDTLVAIAIKE